MASILILLFPTVLIPLILLFLLKKRIRPFDVEVIGAFLLVAYAGYIVGLFTLAVLLTFAII